MSNILRSLMINIGVDLTAAQKGLAKASKEWKNYGKDLTNTGKYLTNGITVPVLGAVVGLGALVNKSLDTADSLQQMADITGLTTERLQELKYIGTKVDVELETMTGAQSKLIKAMAAAQDGTEAQVEAFNTLGISVTDNNGNLRDSNTVFTEAISALGKMTNPTERNAIALKLMGKSAMELNPLINTSAEDLAALTKEAHDNGAVMSGESILAMDAFGDSLEAAKISLSTAANQISVKLMPSLEKLLPIIMDNVVPAITKFADFLGDLIDGFTDLSPQMQNTIGIMAGFAIAIGPALTAFGGLAGNVSLAMKAMSAASKAISAGDGLMATIGALIGPSGVVILATAAIGLLVLGIGYLATQTDPAIKKLNELNKEAEASKKAFENSTKEIDNNADIAEDLSDQLFALADKEKKTGAEIAKMNELVTQLNKLMPELNLKIDKQTGLINLSRQAVTALIEEKKKELMFAAYEDRLLTLYKEKVAIYEDNEAAMKRLTKAQQDYDAAVQTGLNGAIFEATVALSDAQNAILGLAGAIVDNEKAISGIEGSYTGLATSVTTANDQMVASGDNKLNKTKEQLDAESKAVEDANVIWEGLYQSHLSQMGGLENEGIEKSKLTAAEIKKNLEAQIKDFQDWQGAIATLSARVPSDVMSALRGLGPSAVPLIDELSNMSNEKLAEWVEVWRKKGEEAAKAAQLEMDVVPSIGKQVATDLANDTLDSLDEHQSMVNEKYKWSGHNSGMSLADGIREQLDAIKLAADEARMTAKDKIQESYADFNTAGSNASLGFAAGLNEHQDIIRAAAREMALAAARESRIALAERSPSKVFQGIGSYASEGFAIGLTDNMDMIKSAANEMAGSSIPDAQTISTSTTLAAQGLSETSANSQSTVGASASSAKSVNVIVELDGRTLARAMGQPMADMIRMKTGLAF